MPGESQQIPKTAPDPSVITTENIDKAVDGLREILDTRLDGLDALLAERDRRYTERFDAQQLAVKDALNRAKEEVSSAFASSEKAILKAEVSIEKRADATYVSLQELSRSLAALMPRAEAEARISGLADQVSALILSVKEIQAVKTGGNEQRNALYAFVGFVAALVLIGGVLLAAWPR